MSEATVVDKRWTYCPECGSTEIRHAEGDHKQCACCLQEWFADIDYTDVVRTNLGNRMQLRSSLTASDKDAARYRWLRTRINWKELEIRSGQLSTQYRSWEHQDYRQNRPASEHIDDYIDAAMEKANG